jgi:hypothetical protein
MVKEQQRTAGLTSAHAGSAAEARLVGVVAGRSCSRCRRRKHRRDLRADGGSRGDAADDRARRRRAREEGAAGIGEGERVERGEKKRSMTCGAYSW